MYRKLALGVLIACTAASGSIITPAHADTLTGCSCSDAFFVNGVPVSESISTETLAGTDLTQSGAAGFVGIAGSLNTNVVYLFTEGGTGSDAVVSDIVLGAGPIMANISIVTYLSDPAFELTVGQAEADIAGVLSSLGFFSLPTLPASFQVVAETGTPQDLTAFGGNIDGIQFGSDIAAVPGPIAGAGLPGLIAACGVLLVLARRRRKAMAV
jgi:hypothetical protein